MQDKPKHPESDTLFVGRLSTSVDEAGLREFFKSCGSIMNVRIKRPNDAEAGRGYGYVQFASTEEAKRALEHKHGAELANRQIRLDFADPLKPTAAPGETARRAAFKLEMSTPGRMYTFIHDQYNKLISDMTAGTFTGDDNLSRLGEIAGITNESEFKMVADEFWVIVAKAWQDEEIRAGREGSLEFSRNPAARLLAEQQRVEARRIVSELRKAYHDASKKGGVRNKLRNLLIDHINARQISKEGLSSPKTFADLRYPIEWYPNARAMQRKIHLHVGPTNSGKTYHALKRLEEAKSGIYAGPLRLLAHEVYSRLNAKGKCCALITGEERRIPEGYRGHMSSCTVEMVPLNKIVDVAVIDEIQMVADESRGWAWTQAFLGVQAKEVHLCGELRTVELVQKLCKEMGDECIVHTYNRLTPLETMGKSFGGKLDKLEKGDAVILFSRIAIHAMKKEIESTTGKRCAIIYGSLPPEIRAQQAALFNDPNNDYDFLVASDAVGMGLNLGIRRVIFESTVKYNGRGGYSQLSVSEIKQIAGRAGRYKTAAEGISDSTSSVTVKAKRNVGLATTLDSNDHQVLKTAMETEVESIKACGIFPPVWAYKRFAAYFPRGTPFTYILTRLPEIASTSPHFFLCDMDDQFLVADAIEQFDLTVEDRMIFMASPADMRNNKDMLITFASHVAAQSNADLLDIKELELELLDVEVPGQNYLPRLEILHSAITLYLWLSYRFAGVFRSQPLAFHVKGLVEKKIDEALANVKFDSKKAEAARQLRHLRAQADAQEKELLAARRAAEEAKDVEGTTVDPSPYAFATEDGQEPIMDPAAKTIMEADTLKEEERELASELGDEAVDGHKDVDPSITEVEKTEEEDDDDEDEGDHLDMDELEKKRDDHLPTIPRA